VLFCLQKEDILHFVQNILQQQQNTLLDVTQNITKQCADMRILLQDMQHQINQLEDRNRQVVTNATQQNFEVLQYMQQHFTHQSQTHPTLQITTTNPKTSLTTLTPPQPSTITHQHPSTHSRSNTETAATPPVPPPQIEPSRSYKQAAATPPPVPTSHIQTSSHPTTHQPAQHQTAQRRKLHPLIRQPKKFKSHDTTKFMFISDSIFKFLIEDKVTFEYIMQNDLETNIRLFRGYSASHVVQEVTRIMSDTPPSGTTTMVSTFGTVDLTHISRAQVDPVEVAQTVITSVLQLSQLATHCNAKFLYLIPGYIQSLTSEEYNKFSTTIENALKSHNIDYIKISDIMRQISAPHYTTFDEITQNSTHDGMHLTFDTGRETLKHIFAHFNQTCILPSKHSMSKEYYIAQKHLPTGCYKCGDIQHRKSQCPLLHVSVSCDWCKSTSHTQEICPVRLLPCTHCAQFGHFRGIKEHCPYWKPPLCNTQMQHMSLDDNTNVKQIK